MRGRRRVASEHRDVIPQRSYYTRASDIVFRNGEVAEHAFAIFEGWALRFIELADGRRQNLAVLLPGDLSATPLFQDNFHYSIEAVTEVCVTRFPRDDVKQQMLHDPKLLETVMRACAAEQQEAERRVVDLGRRTAEERVCHLLLGLANRVSGNRFRPDRAYAFPLLQRHVADLVGLTSVHVSRVLAELRDEGIADVSRGSLTILNLAELKKIARLG